MRSINNIFLFISILFFAGSCIKEVDYNEGIVNNEKSTIRLPLAPEELVVYAFDAVPGDVDLNVLEIRRDVVSNADLNQTVVAKIALDTNHLKQFNIDNKTNYEVFKGYTLISTAETPFDGNNWTATFAPGEVVKYIKIRFDPSKMDFTKQNALSFTITAASPHEISNHRSLITEVLAKNKWDGVYKVISGTVTRYNSPGVPSGDALSGPLAGNPDVYLVTSGANELTIPIGSQKGTFMWSGGTSGVGGIDGTKITVDPVTNLTTIRSLGNATLGNWDGKENRYDPATKRFILGFRWNPTSSVREYDVILEYKGPR